MINRTDAFRSASATPPLDVGRLEAELGAEGEMKGKGSKGGRKEATSSAVLRSGEVDLETGSALDQFLLRMEDVSVSMNKINTWTAEMERLHKQVLTAVGANEAHRLSLAIDELTSKVNEHANKIRLILKSASEENERMAGTISSSDMRIRRTQQAKQAKKFIELMRQHQNMQNLYKGKYRSQLERQYLIMKPMATREELDRLVGADGAAVLTQQQMFSMSNKALAHTQLTEMKERHHEIVAIEKSIQEIHQMFLDMSLIVDQQGELIDRVGEHVENTLEYTQKAADNMEAAVRSKRRSQRIKWILTIVGLVILAIVGITLAIELGGSNAAPRSTVAVQAPNPPAPVPNPSVPAPVQPQAADNP